RQAAARHGQRRASDPCHCRLLHGSTVAARLWWAPYDVRRIHRRWSMESQWDDITSVAELLELLATVVPCDTVSWTRLDIAGQRVLAHRTHPESQLDVDAALDAVFWTVYEEHPLCHGPG